MNLPLEFNRLNKQVKLFNTGINVKLLGEGRYLLLQGSRVKSYSLHVVLAADKRVVNTLVVSTNAKGILDALDLLERLTLPETSYHRLNPQS